MSCVYNLLPGQREFFEIPHDNGLDVALYQGGFGSGKTFSGSLLGILLCQKYPGIRGLCGAQTYTLLRDTTMQTYFEHLDKMKLQYKFIKSESKIVFDNGSEILFRHLEDPDRLKSLNLGFVEIEEMSDVPYSTFKMLLGRLRQDKKPEWKGFRYRLFGHTNPENSRGWIYDNFVKNRLPYFRRILAPTTDNIYLPKEYIQSMKDSFNEDYYNMYVLGRDMDYSLGLVTKHFVPDVQLRDDLKFNPKFPIHITCDFNIDPMCWYICQHYDNNVYVLKELVKSNTNTAICAEDIAEILCDYKEHSIIINGDATGLSKKTTGTDFIILKNTLQRYEFKNIDIRVMNKNPGIEWRIACWNNMIYGPDKKHHVFIHPSCKYLIYNIENLQTEPGGSRPKKVSTGKIKSDDMAKFLIHPIDAVSYLICLYYPIKDFSLKEYKGPPMSDAFDGKYEKGIIDG